MSNLFNAVNVLIAKRMYILFWLNRSRANNNKEARIMLRVTINKQRINISTDVSASIDLWDCVRQRVKGNNDSAQSINKHLQSCKAKMLLAYDTHFKKGVSFTTNDVVDSYLGKDQVKVRLMDACVLFLEQKRARLGLDFSPNTLKGYSASFSKLKKFLAFKSFDDITLDKIDRKFIAELNQYFRAVLRSSNNTAVKNLKQIKGALKMARVMGWMDHDPFDYFTFKNTETNRTYLNQQEIDVLQNAQLSSEHLIRTRDVFLFQIYTGLSHCDLYKLNSEHIFVNKDGRRWLKIYRTKTGTLSQVPLIKQSEVLLAKYSSHMALLSKNTLLPVPTNQVYNRFLKKVFEEAKVKKNAHSHLARHTFATTIILQNGISMETLSKLVGHTNLRTTQIYGKITDEKISKDVEGLW
jgi:site-specific recombinase XerD